VPLAAAKSADLDFESHTAPINETPAQIRVILNGFLTIPSDQSADSAVVWGACFV